MTPPLPPQMKGLTATKPDGSKALVVSLTDAAKLMQVPRAHIQRWVKTGKVEVCFHPLGQQLVFVESLWAMVPREFQQ